jgi:LysR family transcriptional activator of glutamate synthase operon
MDIRQLRYFAVLARQRHFTRAAALLQIAQPALSQQIQTLERELGVVLLNRTRRRVELTAAGEALLARAERILAELEHTQAEMAEFAGLRRGRVLLGALQSLSGYWLSDVLARFHARSPGIELALREDGSEQLVQLLSAAQLDFALVHVTGEPWPPYLLEAELVAEPLLREELVLIAPPAHPLAGRTEVGFAELHDEAFVAFKPGGGLRRALEEAGAVSGFAPRIVCESANLTTIRVLVAEGLGISLLPRSVASAAGREVAVVPIAEPSLARTVLLTWRTDHQLSAAAETCLAFIRAAAHGERPSQVLQG